VLFGGKTSDEISDIHSHGVITMEGTNSRSRDGKGLHIPVINTQLFEHVLFSRVNVTIRLNDPLYGQRLIIMVNNVL